MKSYYFVFCKDELLLEQQPDGLCTVPLYEEPPIGVKPWTTILNVATLDGSAVKTYAIDTPLNAHTAPTQPLPEGGENFSRSASSEGASASLISVPLRQSYYKLPLQFYLTAGKCAELLYWHHNTQYCGICGGPMKFHTDISKRCEHCGKEVWPQVSPAVIVRITRGEDEILMARARNFRGDFYGLIAGFVETGETLEEAVRREVHEETGLEISDIRYFDSQPWPYPSGIMVGFTARYAGGQIRVQREELKNVAWFHRDHLPRLPEKLSIARRLVDDWLQTD
jgi:NAD+ diphosphatase